jgi:hypothetical protein
MSPRQRWLASLAIVLVMAAAPLRGLIAFAGGRACAPKSCCMAKGQVCPMHHAGGAIGGCRLRSCGDQDAAISPVPLAIASPAAAQPSPAAPAAAARFADVAIGGIAAAPPEPPPPRRLV